MKSSFFPDSLWSYLACGLHFGRRLHRDRQCGLGPSQVEPLVKFLLFMYYKNILGFCSDLDGKESTCHVRDLGSIPGLGRFLGEGNGYPLQYSGLEKSVDYIVHGVTKSCTHKSWTRKLSDFHFHILVSGIQHSDSKFLQIILHLKLQNIGYIPCAVQHILVVYLFYT